MTSEKYFSKWVKEAGRGHVAAFLSWGSLAGYMIASIVRLGMSTQYDFFGIGSSDFLLLCGGLGAALSFLEFIYLLQPKKLDFYYGLPVRKSIVFWSRYVHGMLHFMIPMVLAMTACGLYESTVDMEFMAYSAGYTGRSILAFAAVFLIFYHIGILLLTVCGKILPAILGYAAALFYGTVLAGNAFTTLAENYFHTYYRIPLLEKLGLALTPFSLAGKLTGSGLYDKEEAFSYIPSVFCLAAGFVWIVLTFLLFAEAQKKRKTERVGKVFAIPPAERAAELLLSFGAGVWGTSFFIDLSGLAGRRPGAAFVLGIFPGAAAACAVHFLLEWVCEGTAGRRKGSIGRLETEGRSDSGQDVPESHTEVHASVGRTVFHLTFRRPGNSKGQGRFRRIGQLVLECMAVVFAGAYFYAGAFSFDVFEPKEGQVEAVGISVAGLDMGYDAFKESQLEKYLLSGEGKDAAVEWAASQAQKNSSGGVDEYTHAAVCYHMKNGREIYRMYPVSEEDLKLFASVYETDEYKEKAYPLPNSRYVMDARFLWSDGVTDTVLKLEDREKEALLDAWQKDVEELKMEVLKTALPLGFVDIDSEMRLASTEMAVYPFFGRTCDFLKKHGMQIDKTLADYPVSSVSVSSRGENGMGNRRKFYEEPEEIETWKKKMVPERLDLQPLLYPLDYSRELKAEVWDETTNSAVYVYCYLLGE